MLKTVSEKLGVTVLSDTKVMVGLWAIKAKSVKVQLRPKKGAPPIEDYTDQQELEKAINAFIWPSLNSSFPYNPEKIKNNPWHYILGTQDLTETYPLESHGNGVFSGVVSLPVSVKEGVMYRFLVETESGLYAIKDPRSNFQPFDADGWSQIIDHSSFEWTDRQWKDNPRRIKNSNPYNKLVINELHIGTFTKEGTFEAAMAQLDQIAEDGIFNAIEILPINEFYGHRNWGYDGIDWYAPESSYCKTNPYDVNELADLDKVKQFVDKAHSLGLNVILDVVYNHYGPFYNEFTDILGDYCNAHTPWGKRPNLDNEQVRRLAIDNALFWLKNYHFDGLRLDASFTFLSDTTIKQLMAELKSDMGKEYDICDAFIILEDTRNTGRLCSILTEEAHLLDYNILAKKETEARKKNKWTLCPPELYNCGASAKWNFEFIWAIETVVLDKAMTRYAGQRYVPNIDNIARVYTHGYVNPYFANDEYNINELEENIHLGPTPPRSLVNYFESHDEAGNYDGTRLIVKIVQAKLDKRNLLEVKGPKKHLGQKQAEVVQKLVKAYAVLTHLSLFETLSEDRWAHIQRKSGLLTSIDKGTFAAVFEEARALNRVAMGTAFMAPGNKMMLFGDEEGELSPFKFFAEYPVLNLEKKVSKPSDKGYKIGKEAFLQSKAGKPYFTDPTMKVFTKAITDLYYKNEAAHTPMFCKETDVKTYKKENIFTAHRYSTDESIFVIINYSDKDYAGNVSLSAPEGHWKEVINSNYFIFGGDGSLLNPQPMISEGTLSVNIPKESIIILEKL